jgi:hypothetical protein
MQAMIDQDLILPLDTAVKGVVGTSNFQILGPTRLSEALR